MRFIKIKKRYILSSLLVLFLIFSQSCMMMRMNSKKTQAFFKTSNLSYIDSTLNVEDFNIHYIETGQKEKPTLFFVHGSPGSWDAYKEYLKDSLLLKKYRMIAIDRPGFGYSDFGEPQNLETQAYIISKFIDALKMNSKIVLIGHSMGGPVIVKMATLETEKYEELVVLAGAIDPNAEKPEVWRKIIMTRPLRYLIPGALRPSNDELWWLKQDLIEMKPDLKNITNKVLIIHGTKDPLVPYSNMQFMLKSFVNAKSIDTISIKEANHFIPWEHYETIRNALLDLKL